MATKGIILELGSMQMEKIYYIIRIKDEFIRELSLTTINKEFCGRFIHQSYGNMYFELNGSRALVIIPEKWIESCAPSKALWNY